MLWKKNGVIAPGETLDEITVRMNRLRWAKAWLNQEDGGQAALEFALVAPAMLLVITGICTFGLALSNYMSLTEATDTGARQFAISRGATGDPCAIAISTIQAAAPSLKAANLTYSFTVYTSSAATSSSTYTTTCNGVTLNQSAPVTVYVTYPCNLSWYGVSNALYGGATSCLLKAKTTEVLQ